MSMATILQFRAGVERAKPPVTGGAEIIIFPGVRIKRGEEAPKLKRREKGRTKRDRLELPD
jgi:hypothetical protein